MRNGKYFFISIAGHSLLLLFLMVSFYFSKPMVVIENTNKHDVISAVILGDIQKSRIVAESKPLPTPTLPAKAPPLKPKLAVKKDVIPLQKMKKKKPEELFGKDLLADLDKLKKKTKMKLVKEKQIKKVDLKAQFEKTLRQQLLDEDFKIKGTESHEAQGFVNKYQGLILQSISQHWLIPMQSNKKLSTSLLIRLAADGRVREVRILKSSGDVALDYSARAAVLKASPLPVPKDAKAFAAFREFELVARPEDVAGFAGMVG